MLVLDDPLRTLALWLDGERVDHAVLDAAEGPALVQGQGPLADVVLRVDGARVELREATAVALGGRVLDGRAELHATLLDGEALIHGTLERARGRGCQILVTSFRAARDTDAPTPQTAPAPPSRASAPVAAAGETEDLGWAAVAAASAEAARQAAIEEAERAAIEAAKEQARREARRGTAASGFKRKKVKRIVDQKSTVELPKAAPLPKASSRRSDVLDEPLPEEGDWVHHRQFGVCEVLEIDDEGGMTLRLANGRKRRVILDVFRVLEPRIEDDKIIYPLQPRRR